jgi:hypothetical protein
VILPVQELCSAVTFPATIPLATLGAEGTDSGGTQLHRLSPFAPPQDVASGLPVSHRVLLERSCIAHCEYVAQRLVLLPLR